MEIKLLFLCSLMFAAGSSLDAKAERPNFVVIIADDLGISDLGCYGRPFGNTYHETPNIDRMASGGMKFLNAYASCTVCSPTRASIMTGKYPTRTGITDWIPGEWQPEDRAVLCPRTKTQMELSEITLAEALDDGGYTSSFVGKWHLGEEPKFYPDQQGFDVNIGGCSWGHPKGSGHYYHPFGDELPNLDSKPGDYLTDRLTDEAIGRIQVGKVSESPFLIYLSYYSVHIPLVPKKEVFASLNGKEHSEHWNNQSYAAMVKSLDENVGRVLQALENEGLSDNTVVIFYSDNGGLSKVTSNYPYRGGKGDIYDGGIREPLIVRWPGRIPAGSTSAEPVISMDLYPTLLDIAGMPLTPEQHQDGVSLLPLLEQRAQTLDRSALYWHYPHFRQSAPKMPAGAVRMGDYKLIELYESGEIELYNLVDDPAETHNLASLMPEKAAGMKQQLADWRKQTGAVMPKPNPAFHAKTSTAESGLFSRISASSTETAQGNLPENAVDDDPVSRWAAKNGSFPQWLEADLTEPKEIDGVRIAFRNRTVIKYTVEVADGNGSWTTVIDCSENTEPVQVCEHSFESQQIKKIKITVLDAAGGWATITDVKLRTVTVLENKRNPNR